MIPGEELEKSEAFAARILSYKSDEESIFSYIIAVVKQGTEGCGSEGNEGGEKWFRSTQKKSEKLSPDCRVADRGSLFCQ